MGTVIAWGENDREIERIQFGSKFDHSSERFECSLNFCGGWKFLTWSIRFEGSRRDERIRNGIHLFIRKSPGKTGAVWQILGASRKRRILAGTFGKCLGEGVKDGKERLTCARGEWIE
jgi:hypothetical protein